MKIWLSSYISYWNCPKPCIPLLYFGWLTDWLCILACLITFIISCIITCIPMIFLTYLYFSFPSSTFHGLSYQIMIWPDWIMFPDLFWLMMPCPYWYGLSWLFLTHPTYKNLSLHFMTCLWLSWLVMTFYYS